MSIYENTFIRMQCDERPTTTRLAKTSPRRRWNGTKSTERQSAGLRKMMIYLFVLIKFYILCKTNKISNNNNNYY